MNRSVRPTEGIESVIATYGDTLFRLCLIQLGNAHDAEDALSETFLRYLQKSPPFVSTDHQKAWLIRVATNCCRDMLRLRNRRFTIPLEDVSAFATEASDRGLLEALMQLPETFRVVLVLHYVEGYTTEEIAPMIGKTPSAVKMRLKKGRALLKEVYGHE